MPSTPGEGSRRHLGPQPAPRILYIEENPESRALVRSVLEPRGFDVLEASDGMAGIDLAIASHPDLILCDIQLPGLDGYETATRLRSYKGLEAARIPQGQARESVKAARRALMMKIACFLR